ASCESPPERVAAALALARQQRATTILNPAPVPRAPLERLDLVDYLTPNAGEAARLSGVADEAAAADELVARGAGNVVVTLGEAGALCRGQAGTDRARGVQIQAGGTTAARTRCAAGRGRPTGRRAA